MRRRFSRTLSRARWGEYSALLTQAADNGYTVTSVEPWLQAGGPVGGPTLLLRHDVDQHPATAVRMADIERDHGITSTWYVRWRTADPALVSLLQARGHQVGLHYETLTRRVLACGVRDPVGVRAMMPGARLELRREIDLFRSRFGALHSVCPHGDTRVMGVSNADLLRDEDWASYGIEFDANAAMRGHHLGVWLTDRSRAEGRWGRGEDPRQILRDGISPVLCLVHPNNWCSGPSLWLDRLRGPGGHGAMRTGSDEPPWAQTGTR